MHLASLISSITDIPISSFTSDTISRPLIPGLPILNAQFRPEVAHVPPIHVRTTKLYHMPATNEMELLHQLFKLARYVSSDFKTVRRQRQAGKLKPPAKQPITLAGVCAIHITLTITWYLLTIVAEIGWLLNGL